MKNAFPSPEPTAGQRDVVEPAVARLIALAADGQTARRNLLDWLRVEWGVAKAGRKLADGPGLAADAFLAEVKKRRPKGARTTPAALAALREGFEEVAAPDRRRRAEAAALEQTVAAAVHDAFGLTPADAALLRATAPPRTPPLPD